MSEFPEKSSEFRKKPSELKEKFAVTAVVKAHDMLVGLCGPRGWNDTRESWLTRGARRARLSLRRARAIFYLEPIKLTADEYLAIQEAYQAAHAALATVPGLARPEDLQTRAPAGSQGGSPDAAELESAVPTVRQVG